MQERCLQARGGENPPLRIARSRTGVDLLSPPGPAQALRGRCDELRDHEASDDQARLRIRSSLRHGRVSARRVATLRRRSSVNGSSITRWPQPPDCSTSAGGAGIPRRSLPSASHRLLRHRRAPPGPTVFSSAGDAPITARRRSPLTGKRSATANVGCSFMKREHGERPATRPQVRIGLSHSPSSVRPGWSSGRRPCGQRNRRSDSAIRTSLMLAWRSAM